MWGVNRLVGHLRAHVGARRGGRRVVDEAMPVPMTTSLFLRVIM
jgi:hypothetical protein